MDPCAAEADWLTRTAGVRVLDDAALVSVSGDDARSWLNGQVTCDVRATKAGDAVYGLVLTLKGRILADAWILDRDGTFMLVAPRDVREALLERLEKYVIMEDVTLMRVDDRTVLTVQGPAAAQVVGDTLESYPCDRLGTGGRDVLVATAEADATCAALATRARAAGGGVVSDRGWELARLALARPRFARDFGEKSYPQEAGLETSAVSFSKGCYLGQEVVCMLENRGQLVRRLVSLDVEGAPPAPGTPLCAPAGGEPIGEITSSAARADSATRSLALGYVKRALALQGTALHAGESSAVVRATVGGA